MIKNAPQKELAAIMDTFAHVINVDTQGCVTGKKTIGKDEARMTIAMGYGNYAVTVKRNRR